MTEKKIEAVKEEKKRLNFKYLRDKDAQLVTGKFIFHEVPGGAMEFSYKAYKGEQVEKYNFKDNEVYKVPFGIAKHLNTNGWYPIYKDSITTSGAPFTVIAEKKRRFSFQSLEFMDIADLNPTPHILEVITN